MSRPLQRYVRVLKYIFEYLQLLEDDTLGVGSAGEGLLPLIPLVGLLVLLVRPPVVPAEDTELTRRADTAGLRAGTEGRGEKRAKGGVRGGSWEQMAIPHPRGISGYMCLLNHTPSWI